MIVIVPKLDVILELKVTKNTTVYSIKLAIEKKLSISKESLNIFLYEKILADDYIPLHDKNDDELILVVSISEFAEKKETTKINYEIKEEDIKYFENIGFTSSIIIDAIQTSEGDLSKARDLLFNSRTVKVVSVKPIYSNASTIDSGSHSDSDNSSSDIIENTLNISSLINSFYDHDGNWDSIRLQFPTIPVSTLHFILYWLCFTLQKCPQVYDLSLKTSKVKKLFIYYHQNVKIEDLCKLLHMRDLTTIGLYYDIINNCIRDCESLQSFSKENPDMKIHITKYDKIMDQIEHLMTKKKEDNQNLNVFRKELENISSPEIKEISTDINGFFILPDYVINIPNLVDSFVHSGYSEESLFSKYPEFSSGYLIYLLYLVHLRVDRSSRKRNNWRPKELRFLLEQGYEGASISQMKEFLDEKEAKLILPKLKMIKKSIKNSKNFDKFAEKFKDFVVPSISCYDDDGIPDYLESLFDEFSAKDEAIHVNALTILLPDNEIVLDHQVRF